MLFTKYKEKLKKHLISGFISELDFNVIIGETTRKKAAKLLKQTSNSYNKYLQRKLDFIMEDFILNEKEYHIYNNKYISGDTFMFGQYENETFKDVLNNDPEYILWCIQQKLIDFEGNKDLNEVMYPESERQNRINLIPTKLNPIEKFKILMENKKVAIRNPYGLRKNIPRVYFVRDESKKIKIGFSRNPKQRLKELQTSNPEKLEIILEIKGTLSDERMFHKIFKEYRLQGEWFSNNKLLRDTLSKLGYLGKF